MSTVEAAIQANYLAVAPGYKYDTMQICTFFHCFYTDFLRGVEVYRETVLEVVGNKPQL